MASCLLCLNLIKYELDSIKTYSSLWQELDVGKKLEKHFWPLSTIQPNSLICLPCWQEVDDFHKFYSRIEEIHMNLYKIKIENDGESKEESTELSELVLGIREPVKDNMEMCFMEPEILINPNEQQNAIETYIALNKETSTNKTLAEEDLCNTPLNQCELMNLQSKDPLAKMGKSNSEKSHKSKHQETFKECKKSSFKVPKKEPLFFNDNDLESSTTQNNDDKDVSNVSSKFSSENIKIEEQKHNLTYSTKREENDKFIAKHFKQMFCDLCQKPFKDFPDMQKHFLDIHKQPGYLVCCKRKYHYRKLLIDHIHSHLNPNHFKCNQCEKIMSDRSRLEKHIRRVHCFEKIVKKYSCEICGKSFIDAHHLRMHSLTHLTKEEKKFPCKECGKFYGSSYFLDRHRQVVHLKKFAKICHICGKSISCTNAYKIHMNKHEGTPQPAINCDVCGLRLASQTGLKRHKDTQHPVDGKKEHHCPECPKISPTLKALRKHISTMHVKGFDHKCTICEKAFKRAEVLREHMASHTGTPLYTCPWCPKTFNSNGNMHAHRKKMHPKEWQEAKLQKYSADFKQNIVDKN